MAEGSRFPHLALPFAVAGAAGGWLSANMAANPLIMGAETNTFGVAALVAMVAGGLTGLLLTRWCVGKRLSYQMGEPDPATLADSDRWWRHIAVVIFAGALCAVVVGVACRAYDNPAAAAAGGAACALAFLPVCALVIVTARRAKRARLGSIVAASDRRAVWGILATALAAATLEVAPSWPAFAAQDVPEPTPALAILGLAGVVILTILLADARALRRARDEIAPGLLEADMDRVESADTAAPRVDLGLGDELAARVARSAAAYRGRDRTLALVLGSPEQAISALRRALVRGGAGIGVVLAISLVHLLATSGSVLETYDCFTCEGHGYRFCGRAAARLRSTNPWIAAVYFDRACDAGDGSSCAAAATMYERGEGVAVNMQQARLYRDRACDQGDFSSCGGFHPFRRE